MQPDFSKFTLEELLDVQKNIDKDLYPERFKIVSDLINTKINAPQETEPRKFNEKSSKTHRILYVVAFFWFFAIYSIIKGEFNLKSYTATYANDPLGFFIGVGIYFAIGIYLYLLYRKQCSKLINKD